MCDLFAWLFCFSAAILLNKFILQSLPPMLFVGIRMVVPALFLLVLQSRQSLRKCVKEVRRYFSHIFFLILFTTFIPMLCKSFALKYLPVAKVVLIGSLDPFVASFYAYLFWQEVIDLQKLFSMLVVFLGTALLVVGKSPQEASLISFGVVSLAELAALISVFVGKLGWLYVSRFVKTEVFSSQEINMITMLGAGLFGMLIAGIKGEFVHLSHLQNLTILSSMVVALVANTLGYIFFTEVLRQMPFTTVSVAGCIIPVLVSFGGCIFFREPLTVNILCAAVLIFSAIAIFRHANREVVY